MENITIGIIGAGNMGSAFFHGLKEYFNQDYLWICDADAEKLKVLGAINTTTEVDLLVNNCHYILLAVKPQNFPDIAPNLEKVISDKIIISIMAGISIKNIYKATKFKSIVRAMPNLAAQSRQAFTAWVASGEVSSEEKEVISKIFSAVGKEEEIKNEQRLDEITALSGSGPAYFFYLAELLKEKAVEYKFTEAQAQEIAVQTLVGAASFLQRTKIDPAEARAAVTSKGGTTEAAIKYMQGKGFSEIFKQALNEAKNRSSELNN